MRNSNRILLIRSNLPKPRVNRRIELLLNAGYAVDIVYWNMRKNCKVDYVNGADYYSIDEFADRKEPLRRINSYVKLVKKIHRFIYKLKPDIIYAENLDMLFLTYVSSFLLPKCKIIYEIADIHRYIIDKPTNYLRVVVRKILYLLEKKLSKSVSFLILTSNKFYDVYYREFYSKNKIIYMPNIPDFKVLSKESEKLDINKDEELFLVGFFGEIRYKKQLINLIKCTNHLKFKAIIAGREMIGDTEISDLCKSSNSIADFYGAFDYAEISKLYKTCDCIYCVYNSRMNNVKVALPNKLYEAIYFELPIIVAKNTYLSEIVDELGIGLSVDCEDINELAWAIKKLKCDTKFYNACVENCRLHAYLLDVHKNNQLFLDCIRKIITNTNTEFN